MPVIFTQYPVKSIEWSCSSSAIPGSSSFIETARPAAMRRKTDGEKT